MCAMRQGLAMFGPRVQRADPAIPGYAGETAARALALEMATSGLLYSAVAFSCSLRAAFTRLP